MSELNTTIENAKKLLKVFRFYHRYSAFGVDRVPDSGPVILITNHSLATYDGFLLGMEIYEKSHRLPMGLGDNMLFKVPGVKKIFTDLGIRPGNWENAKNILNEGNILAIAPGGMRESLRPSSQKYQLLWAKRKGFIKLAIEQQAPIVLAACPNADRIFRVYESLITALIYKKFRFPLPFFRGIGLSMIPRPVKLTHFVSQPIYPPSISKDSEMESAVDDFHYEISKRMRLLMNDAKHRSY